MKEMAELGQLIRQTRENRGLEAQVLAQRIGVSKGTISNLERGVLKNTPESSMLRAISSELGLPVSKMLETLGYLDAEAGQEDSPAVAALRPILESADLNDKEIRLLVGHVRNAVDMLKGNF